MARLLDPVVGDKTFSAAAAILLKRANLFDELRAAMRLHPSTGSNSRGARILTPQQEAAELQDIRRAVDHLKRSLRRRRPARGPAHDTREAIDIVLQHLKRHGHSLWGHAIPLPKKAGGGFYVLDRTNNLLEGFFRFENKESLRPTARGFKIANGDLGREIRALRSKCRRLKERISALPERIAAVDAEGPPIVKLDPETKHLTDAIKMLAYRTETALVGLLHDKVYARTEEEGRALVREILRTPADVLPDERAGVLRVRLHGLANPRSNEAVRHLCEALNETEISYPGTRLRMRYEPGFVPSISATGQES